MERNRKHRDNLKKIIRVIILVTTLVAVTKIPNSNLQDQGLICLTVLGIQSIMAGKACLLPIWVDQEAEKFIMWGSPSYQLYPFCPFIQWDTVAHEVLPAFRSGCSLLLPAANPPWKCSYLKVNLIYVLEIYPINLTIEINHHSD